MAAAVTIAVLVYLWVAVGFYRAIDRNFRGPRDDEYDLVLTGWQIVALAAIWPLTALAVLLILSTTPKGAP